MTACESSANDEQIAPISLAKLDLERVEAVVDVLGHLGDPDRDPEVWAGKVFVQSKHHVAAAWICLADNGFGWIEKVAHAGPLAQELGVHAHPEVDPGALARCRFQPWDQQVLARARHHGAAVDHDVPAVLVRPAPHRSASVTCSRNAVVSPPPGAEGVPTQTTRCPCSRQRRRASVVTVRLPAATTSAVRSPIRSSTTGDLPCRRASTLSGLTSTPTT